MYFGVAWYPEHWLEEAWVEDLRLMREAGMNVVRLAEFAWSAIEPREGQYEFDWLERAITLAHDNGLAVVLGTPTAAPPAWLTHRHPDTLAIEPDGRPAQHGNRCHVAPNSPTYQRFTRRIVEQMAKHFGQDARVIGWQIDNEYNRVDYSDNTRRRFQEFLREQYGSLEALNRHWSTAYWSQSYTDWDEIPIPIGPHNPGLMMAFKNYVTRMWRDYQHLQIDALRHFIRPEQWITHNFIGYFDAFDHYELAADLDFVAWDWYVGTGHHQYLRSGMAHDLTRGLKQRNFWIMETQPGCVNWASINNMLHRGEARCMAWHAIAHGAEAILYWQWRSAYGGQEQLHGTLIGADGKPRPFYQEAKAFGRDLQALGPTLDNATTPQNEVALLHSYPARWSLNAQRHHEDFNPVTLLEHYYAPLAKRNVGVDVVAPEAWLGDYKLVIAPALVILSDENVENLTAFVQGGGTLVLTVRCGQKDIHNALFSTLQPGPLRELAGVEVREFYALVDPVPLSTHWGKPLGGQTQIWAEWLQPLTEKTEVLARYGEANGWLDGQPAITRHAVGLNGGQVIYVGGWLMEPLQSALTDWLLAQAQVAPIWEGLPEGVEVVRRVTPDGTAYDLAINHRRTEVQLPLQADSYRDLLTDTTFTATLPLPPYGVRVLQQI